MNEEIPKNKFAPSLSFVDEETLKHKKAEEEKN